MQLFAALLDLQLSDRLSYDADRNTLFVNFEGMSLRSAEDIESVRRVFEALFRRIGHKVALVVNYDGFRLDETLSDAYFEMVSDLQGRYYSTAVRYTTSAFMRMKLGAELAARRSAAHVFETIPVAEQGHRLAGDRARLPCRTTVAARDWLKARLFALDHRQLRGSTWLGAGRMHTHGQTPRRTPVQRRGWI